MTEREKQYVIDALAEDSWRMFRILGEFVQGFEEMNEVGKAVTIFGSSRLRAGTAAYDGAQRLAAELVAEGYAVLTGGGPGIMEAANRGAFESGGRSVGLNISLPHEQAPNRFQTDSLNFTYFFVRTMKIKPFPVYLVGTEYWQGLLAWLQDTLVREGTISPKDLQLFKLVDDVAGLAGEIEAYYRTEGHAGFSMPNGSGGNGT